MTSFHSTVLIRLNNTFTDFLNLTDIKLISKDLELTKYTIFLQNVCIRISPHLLRNKSLKTLLLAGTGKEILVLGREGPRRLA